MASAQHPMRHVALCGYVGFDNLGDELILQAIVKILATHEDAPKPLHLTVFSQTPLATQHTLEALIHAVNPQSGLTVTCIYRQDAKAIVKALWQANGFITGGGGLFQDKTGWKSPVYYGGLMLLAWLLGCKTMAFGQGMGPLTTGLGRFFAAYGLDTATAVVVRDADSAKVARSLVRMAPVVQTTDTVWIDFKEGHSVNPSMNQKYTLGVSLRPWPSLTAERIQALAIGIGHALLTAFPNQTLSVALLPCEPHTDDAVLHTFQQALSQVAPAIAIHYLSPLAVEDALPQCEAVVGMRYHAVVLAAKAQRPVWGLVYDPKVASVCDALELPSTAIEEVDMLTTDSLAQWLQHPVLPKPETLKSYQALAQINKELLLAWLMHQPLPQL